MDDYHIKESKFREVLHILRPPVKRNHRKLSQYDCVGYVISDSDERNIINIPPKKYTRNKKESDRPVRPSLSLVLEKTSKKQILEQYPDGRKNVHLKAPSTDTNKVATTIKVTIVPKKNPDSILEVLENKNQSNRNYNKNPSCREYENSISTFTKKVYFVVAGKEKDKIYEIKATGNKNSEDKHKDVKFDKKKIPSKMGKNRQKSLNVEGDHEDQKCSNSLCFCRCSKKDINLSLEDEYPNGTSRVRIVGRIGLNQDDKYVMKCAATVDGQPVRTSYSPSQNSSTDISERPQDERRDTKPEKNPIRFSSSSEDVLDPLSDSTTSHVRQIDASVQLTKICSTTDRNTQCNLCELCNNTEKKSNYDDESQVISLNRSTSPLVIISVYPKPELKSTTTNRFDAQNNRPIKLSEMHRVTDFSVNTDLYNVRDIPVNKTNIPSCCPGELSKKDEATCIEDDTKITNNKQTGLKRATRSPSPDKKRPKSPKAKTQEPKKETPKRKKETQERKKDFTEIKTAKVKPKSRSPSPKRIEMKDKFANNNINKDKKTQQNTNLSKHTKVNTFAKKKEVRREQNDTLKFKSRACDSTVNTREQTIKYKRSIPKHIIPTHRDTVLRQSLSRNIISKVSINIDNEKEFYDVVFENGNVSADLTVKRTAKDKYSQKYDEGFENHENNGHNSDSLANFFLIPTIESDHSRSASQRIENNEENDVFPLYTSMSRLNVRDSLEIGHRRDVSKHHIKNESDEETANDLFFPPKHYPGDDCVTNPIQRDKEIRELLGVSSRPIKRNTIVDASKHKIYSNSTVSRRCHVPNALCKSLEKKPALYWPSLIKNCTYSYKDEVYIPKRDEDKSITDDEKQKLMKLGACTKIKKQDADLEEQVKLAVIMKQQSTQYIAQAQTLQKQNVISLSRNQYRKVKKMIHVVNERQRKEKHTWNSSFISIGSIRSRRKSEYEVYLHQDVQTELPKVLGIAKLKRNVLKHAGDNNTVVLFYKEPDRTHPRTGSEIKKVASSIEIRYTSIAYGNIGERNVKLTPREVKYKSNLVWKGRDSIETIFRGHKKSLTPNLGTSSLSLLSEEVKSTAESLPTGKPRKPFLRRLMSCLVMKSETTPLKLPPKKPKTPTMDSSVDSYYVSTSLGAMEMSSSIYDTSVSFYSDRAIGVINTRSKNKRSFFTSVREFLSVKKN